MSYENLTIDEYLEDRVTVSVFPLQDGFTSGYVCIESFEAGEHTHVHVDTARLVAVLRAEGADL